MDQRLAMCSIPAELISNMMMGIEEFCFKFALGERSWDKTADFFLVVFENDNKLKASVYKSAIDLQLGLETKLKDSTIVTMMADAKNMTLKM